jgi:hypothetical protein
VDAESLAQIERLVTSAAEGLRHEIADVPVDVRQEIADVKTALQGEIRDVKTGLQQEIADVRASLQQQITNVGVDLGQKIDHTGVLVEDLRQDVRLLAEGFQAHADRRHAEDEHRVRTIEQHLGLTV